MRGLYVRNELDLVIHAHVERRREELHHVALGEVGGAGYGKRVLLAAADAGGDSDRLGGLGACGSLERGDCRGVVRGTAAIHGDLGVLLTDAGALDHHLASHQGMNDAVVIEGAFLGELHGEGGRSPGGREHEARIHDTGTIVFGGVRCGRSGGIALGLAKGHGMRLIPGE